MPLTAPEPDHLAHRKGLAAAFAAYFSWGILPVYFKVIASVNAWEIITHRIIWGLPVLLLFLWLRDGRRLWTRMRVTVRQLAWLAVSGSLVSINWLLFVWAVTHDQVLATSLGYFITPLVNILLGFLFLHERLTSRQQWGVGIAALGTAYLAWFLEQPPWISLTLALTFAFYGLVRKRLGVRPMVGLMWEFLLVFGPALAFLSWRAHQGHMDFLAGTASRDFWLLMAGLLTVLPLIWFNIAAQRLTLTTLGFIQYLAPSMTFLMAVFLWGESFTQGHAVAFGCIWTALLLVSIGPLRSRIRVQPID